MKLVALKLLISFASLVCSASAAWGADYTAIPVDQSLLEAALPLQAQQATRAVRRYEMQPSEVDRRFTCAAPSSNLKLVVEIAHTNDQAHTATVQLVNPEGVIEASFLSTAQRLPRYPDVNLDSYKIRFGEELSTLVINSRRLTGKPDSQPISGLLQTDGRVEVMTCSDELLDPPSLLALDSSWQQNYNEAKATELPKSVCTIHAIVEQNRGKFICSAVLVARNIALTANHCLSKIQNQMAVLTCPNARPVEINVSESLSNKVHDAEPWKVANDIAVLKLKTNSTAQPAQLATTAAEGADLLFTQSESCGLYGYGNQFDGRQGELHGVRFSPPPEDLGGVTLTIENYQNEKLITSDPRYFLRPGDSGGGVICTINNEEVVVGIHSFSYPLDSSVNSASVGHNYQWLIEQIDKINGVQAQVIPANEDINPNLSAPRADLTVKSSQTW